MLKRSISFIMSFIMIFLCAVSAITMDIAKAAGDSGKIYLNTNSIEGFGYINFHADSGSTAAFEPMEAGGYPYIHLKASANQSYVNINTGITAEEDYVLELDMYIKDFGDCRIHFSAKAADGTAERFLTIGKQSITNLYYLVNAKDSTKIATLEKNAWNTIKLVCHPSGGQCDVYVNSSSKKGLTIPTAVKSPKEIGVQLEAGSTSERDIYLDKIKLYSGSTLRNDITPPSLPDKDSYYSAFESESYAQTLIGDDVVFGISSNYYFANGVKEAYPQGKSAYTEDDIAYVSSDIVSSVFGTAIQSDTYVDIADYAKNTLGKYAYTDKRGFVIVSDNPISYSDSSSAKDNLEPIDYIYRYILYDRPSAEELINDITAANGTSHPRIFIKQSEIEGFKAAAAGNEFMKAQLDLLTCVCDNYLSMQPVAWNFTSGEGQRLFNACMQVRNRIFNLGVAYLATGTEAYIDRVKTEMMNALSWEHWNLDGSFLDSGNIGAGIAFAYDLLCDSGKLTDSDKAIIREKIQTLYLDYAVGVFTQTSKTNIASNQLTGSNWNAVCGTSMFLVGLAFIDDTDPSLSAKAKFVAENALKSLEYGMGMFYPDGAISEGMGYWGYYVENSAWLITALTNACGTDYGFLSSPGYKDVVKYGISMRTSNGCYNYNETNGTSTNTLLPELFAAAQLYNDSSAMEAVRAAYEAYDISDSNNTKDINTEAYSSRTLMFYRPSETEAGDYPLDNLFGGEGIVAMRSGYESDDSYMAAIGGTIYGESQFDKGSFIYENGGVRWLHDLGAENKDVEGGFYYEDGYTLYRKRAEGHNAVVINPSEAPGQTPGGTASVTRFESKPRGAIAVYDLADVYREQVTSYNRGFYMANDRKSLIVQDEIALTEESNNIYWYLHTKGDIVISSDKKSAVIYQGGKELKVEVLCSVGDGKWHLEAQAADPLDTAMIRQSADKGKLEYSRDAYSKIALIADAGKSIKISARLTLNDGTDYGEFEDTDISAWEIPDGEITNTTYPEQYWNGGGNTPSWITVTPSDYAKQYKMITVSDTDSLKVSAAAGTQVTTQLNTHRNAAVWLKPDVWCNANNATIEFKLRTELTQTLNKANPDGYYGYLKIYDNYFMGAGEHRLEVYDTLFQHSINWQDTHKRDDEAQWTHIAFSRNKSSKTIDLYIDGSHVCTFPDKTSLGKADDGLKIFFRYSYCDVNGVRTGNLDSFMELDDIYAYEGKYKSEIEVSAYSIAKYLSDKYKGAEVYDANGAVVSPDRELKTGMVLRLESGREQKIKVKNQIYLEDFEGWGNSWKASSNGLQNGISFYNTDKVGYGIATDANGQKKLKITVPPSSSAINATSEIDWSWGKIKLAETIVLSYDVRSNAGGNIGLRLQEYNSGSSMIAAAMLENRHIAVLSKTSNLGVYDDYHSEKFQGYEIDKWYNISLVMDAGTSLADIYIDGIRRIENYDLKKEGVDFSSGDATACGDLRRLGIGLFVPASSGAYEAQLDNIKLYSFPSRAAAENAIAPNVIELSSELNIKSVNFTNAIYLYNPMTIEKVMSNISIAKGDNLTASGDSDDLADENTLITLTSSNGLNKAVYHIAGKSGIANLHLEQNGRAVEDVETGTLYAVADKLKFVPAQSAEDTVIIATYCGDSLEKVNYITNSLSHKEISIEISDKTTSVKAFVWNSIEGLSPVNIPITYSIK